MPTYPPRLACALAASIAIGAVPAYAQQAPAPQQAYPAPSTGHAYPQPAYSYPAPGYQGAYAPPGYAYSQPAYTYPQAPGAYAQPAAPGVYAQTYYPPQPGGMPPDQRKSRLEPGEHRFSLVVSVVHPLVFSIYDASGEFRLGRNAGLAILAGVGSASLKQFSRSLPDESARVYEGGMQLRFYPVGTFDHGLQIGGEIVYLTGSASTTGTFTAGEPPVTYTGAFTAKGSGFKAGAFVGYKLTLPVGFTLMAQIGVDYLSLKAIAKDDNGNARTGDTKTAFLLADAGVGWSF